MIVWVSVWYQNCITFPDKIVLRYTTMSGNVMTVWLLTFLSTDHCIFWQGRIVDQVLVLVCAIWMRKTSCLPQVGGSPAAAGKLQSSDARRRSYCWCCCGLWLHARTHNPPLGRRGVYVERHSRFCCSASVHPPAHMPIVLGWEDRNADKLLNVNPLVSRVLCEALLWCF